MIVGIGELLWDVFPDGRKVAGGAPFNFAFHCQQLGHPAAIVSRVGDDDLGRELREEVRRLGLSDEFIQTDRDHPTGTVRVSLDAAGQPSYEIVEDVAWDYIEWDMRLEEISGSAAAVCFGTLAQRGRVAAETIRRLVRVPVQAVKVFDVNLRGSWYSPEIIKEGLNHATWVKINKEELTTTLDLLGREWGNVELALIELCFKTAEWPHVVTRGILSLGPRGCTVLEFTPWWNSSIGGNRYEEEWIDEPGVPARVVDTVGAGDAFTAAMVCLHLEGRPLRDCARFANHYAARVCEHQGATPRIDRAEVERAAFGTPP